MTAQLRVTALHVLAKIRGLSIFHAGIIRHLVIGSPGAALALAITTHPPFTYCLPLKPK